MPKSITDFIVVCDTHHPPPPHLQFMINLLSALSKGYPDRLHELTSCPVSKIVQIIMSVLLPLMPSRLASKIILIGEADAKSKLSGCLENGADDIPRFLGGKADHEIFYPKGGLFPEKTLTFDFDGMIERLRASVKEFESKKCINHESSNSVTNNRD